MTAILWTPQARDDLAAVHEFISRESTHYAHLVVRGLLASVTRLADFPGSGRIVPEFRRPDLREVLWQSYRIVYRHVPSAGQVQILTVFRSERLFPGLREGGAV